LQIKTATAADGGFDNAIIIGRARQQTFQTVIEKTGNFALNKTGRQKRKQANKVIQRQQMMKLKQRTA